MSSAWPAERALDSCEVGEDSIHRESGRYTGKGKGRATPKGPTTSTSTSDSMEKAVKRSDVGGESSKAIDQPMHGAVNDMNDINDGVESNGLLIQHLQDDSGESRRGSRQGDESDNDNEAFGDAVDAGSPSGEAISPPSIFSC